MRRSFAVFASSMTTKPSSAGLEVLYSPSRLPYACRVVQHWPQASSSSSSSSSSSILAEVKFTLSKQVAMPTLLLPLGPIQGDHNIARYFARLCPSLRIYEADLKTQQTVLIDGWIDAAIDDANWNHFVNRMKVQLAKAPYLVLPEGPCLADIVAWSTIQAKLADNNANVWDKPPAEVGNWLESCGSHPAFKAALTPIVASSSSSTPSPSSPSSPSAVGGGGKKKAKVAAAASSSSTPTSPPASSPSTAPAPENGGKVDDSKYSHLKGLHYFKAHIGHRVAALCTCTAEELADTIEEPGHPLNGDLSLPCARLSKKLGNPMEFASEMASTMALDDIITGIKAGGPFLNFFINKKIVAMRTLAEVYAQQEKYGCSNVGEGKTVVVEFSSPNIAKPFHAGHLRSTIIGNYLANIHEALGYKTIRINYLGDWGKQYGLLAVGFERFGSEEKLKENAIRHLFDVYVKINKAAEADKSIHDEARAYFKRMEDGDESVLSLWRRFRDLSIEKYKQMYERLNIHFDVYSGESYFGAGMEAEMKILRDKNLLTEDKGAKVVKFGEPSYGTAIVEKSDGATLYLTRDIAAASYRANEYHFDKMIYVVAAQQDLHFRQLFKILDMMGYEWANRCVHINFGMVKGMATRRGEVVFLEDILDYAKTKMHNQMRKNEEKYSQISDPESVADMVGLSAILIQDMNARRIRDYSFRMADDETDRNSFFAFEGDTGPYLQFAHSRLSSIERKYEGGIPHPSEVNYDLINVPEALEIVDILIRFPDEVKHAGSQLEACIIVAWMMKLSHAISSAVEKLYVLGQPEDIAKARVLLYHCARVALGNALRLLGIRPLERM